MASIEAMIQWMAERQGKVTYSMTNRLGPTSYDCSSAVYFALRAGGFLSSTKMGNTDTLFGDLEAAGWKKVSLNSQGYYDVKRGDIFIWGKRGASGGASGHTGIFVDSKDQMIHCNYGYNGITVNDHDSIWSYNGGPDVTVYRYNGTSISSDSSTNMGSLDVLEMKNGKVHAGGWHYAIGQREFIFALDAKTGKEITRVKAPAVTRNDVQKAYPNLSGANQCGFNVLLDVPAGRTIKIMARTTNSTSGDSDYIDLHFSKTLTVSKSFSVGQKATLQTHASHYQTGQKIPTWAKNKSYTIKQVKSVNQSNSKKAYLLKEISSWVLEQDLT